MSHMVAVAGEGPAIDAVRAALSETDATVVETEVSAIDSADLAVVAGVAGAGGFATANSRAVETDTPWIAITAGGLGDREFDDLAASVAGFRPGHGCYRCLSLRLEASSDTPVAEDSVPTTRADLRLGGAIAGREVVRSLEGTPFTGVIEVPHARRPLHQVPTCPICGDDRDWTPKRGGGELPVSEAAGRAERTVDPRVGIVATVGERESYPAPYYIAALGATESFSDTGAARHGAGVDPDWDRAYVKAVGETLERYAAGVYRTDRLPQAPPGTLENPVRPSAFVVPDEADLDDEAFRQWVPGIDLHTGATAHLPAAEVLYPPPGDRIRPAITTGLGAGTSIDAALRSGLLEVIERDAAMLSWYSSDEPPAVAAHGDRFEALQKRAKSEELSVDLRLLTRDLDVPVVGAVVTRATWPRFAAGSAAGFDAEATAASALCEALQNWMELRSLGRDRAADAGHGVAQYAESPDPANELVGDTDLASVDTDALTSATVDNSSTAVDRALEQLGTADLRAYAVRLTTPDVAAVDFEVVRVIVPGAQPLFLEEAFFGERAEQVAAALGVEPALDRPIHPYP